MEVKRKSSLRKKGKGLCGFLLALCMAMTTMPALSMTVYAAPTDDIQEGTTVLGTGANTTTAATVFFGVNSGTPIAWRVIGYNGQANGAASESGCITLIAKENLALSKFAPASSLAEYESSTLKQKVDEIAGNLSDGENYAVFPKNLTDVYGNSVNGAILWPLSTNEANSMDSGLRQADPANPDLQTSCWWLRSRSGSSNYGAAFVNGDGNVDVAGDIVGRVYGVRPAFNLNLDSVLFSSAAEGGKSNFGAVGTNDTNEWKLTLNDGTGGFTATLPTVGKTGGSVTVNVTVTGSGTHNQTSAMLVDSSNKVVAYGKIGEATTGDMTFTIPATIPTGTYTLKVFREQVNGNKETDYAGNVVENTSFQITAPVTPTPIASVNNIIVTGTNGTALSDIDVSITLTDEKFKDITADTDVSGWFKNLPAGLTAKIKETVVANATTVKVTISGIPTQASSEAMTIKIPGASLASDAELTVTTNANAKWEISDSTIPVTPTPIASVNNIIVTGTKGTALSDMDVSITLTDEKFKDITADTDVSGWFKNLPAGLTAKIKETVVANATTVKVTISGIPTQASSEAMTIKIPGASLVSGDELTVTTNANAKWEIEDSTSGGGTSGGGGGTSGGGSTPSGGGNIQVSQEEIDRPNPFVNYLQTTTGQIAGAKEGATVTIDFGDFNVLTLPVMKQMAMRRDLTIQMKYRYKGQKFEVTFPAGMPIKYQDDIRYYGPLKLADMANRDGGICKITD